MVASGLTTCACPVRLPGIQVYAVAPVALTVAELPGQIAFVVANAFTRGRLFTVTVTGVIVLGQPAELNPITE